MNNPLYYKIRKLFFWLTGVNLWLAAGSLFAKGGGGGNNQTLGDVAAGITATFADIAYMITGGSYIAGLGFSIGAIMKFKQHKDNPTQIPIGTPIALVFIAAALLFLPSILNITGQTMFSGGQVAGPSGTLIGTSTGG